MRTAEHSIRETMKWMMKEPEAPESPDELAADAAHLLGCDEWLFIPEHEVWDLARGFF